MHCGIASVLAIKVSNVGALINRIVFFFGGGVYYTIIIIRNPQNPTLIIQAPALRDVGHGNDDCRPVLSPAPTPESANESLLV